MNSWADMLAEVERDAMRYVNVLPMVKQKAESGAAWPGEATATLIVEALAQ